MALEGPLGRRTQGFELDALISEFDHRIVVTSRERVRASAKQLGVG
jgi:hypothetical protein